MGLGSIFKGAAILNPVALGGTMLAGGLDYLGQHQANVQSREMADAQMAFQERMSSTAHQREVADLKAAGLNPMLSVNAGASSPAGTMGDVSNVFAGAANNAQKMAGLVMEKQRLDQDIKESQARQEKAKQDAELSKAEKELTDMRKFGSIRDAIQATNEADFRQKFPGITGFFDAMGPSIKTAAEGAKDIGFGIGALKLLGRPGSMLNSAKGVTELLNKSTGEIRRFKTYIPKGWEQR